ncbi:SPRY domain-containing protein 3-like isoform X2 [Apostichopus japonicus]|uniref:SPRY domain-containing protein 3-like isoform X2 n=1 Tax=Stichopus japonicus TaxID=307972 RepID=UPI003AB2E245
MMDEYKFHMDAFRNLHWDAVREPDGFGRQERSGNEEDNDRVQHDDRILVRNRNGIRLIARRVLREPGMGGPSVAKFQPVLDERNNQFEIAPVFRGYLHDSIHFGLVPIDFPLDTDVGKLPNSYGLELPDGKGFFEGTYTAKVEAKGFERVGVVMHFDKAEPANEDGARRKCPVSFTVNGKEILRKDIMVPAAGLCPAVSLVKTGQRLKVIGRSFWTDQLENIMIDDSGEDDWARLHDVALQGQILSYAGHGCGIDDVGLAQARRPLTPTNYYFELKIVDPGKQCFIAIGLARRNYPSKRHPGWVKGSIAYHADDGKLFEGRGIGEAFGPRCHKGDTMGCGIIFPVDYDFEQEEVETDESTKEDQLVNNFQHRGGRLRERMLMDDRHPFHGLFNMVGEDNFEDYEYLSDEEDTDIVWGKSQAGKKVFFTRNGNTIGRRDTVIPPGGFYPTVGMISLNEKVHLNLRPLTG